ncbi:MAG: putative toxin-antitoxin system toxin component, PIN family [Chloroflexi bacterium]|nr:putative toxin-antitoxin system toxin component, PIN family [Chloroflexota bacterium]
MTIKVILDANVFLSYLLAPVTERTITMIVAACFTEEIDLIVPPELLAEIVEKLQSKRYFRERVPQELITNFVEQMTLLAASLAPLETIPAFSRDPDDDYLIAYGLLNDVDYLVTGDLDLLILKQIQQLKIVRPQAFLDILIELGLYVSF